MVAFPLAPSNNPSLAVTIPTESILVTSSYVIVPATDILPLNDAAVPTIVPAALMLVKYDVPVVSIPTISLENAVLAIPTHLESA